MKEPIPSEYFEKKLAQELARLKRRCDEYDAGEISAADDIAASIALIALDKRGAPSLLTHLDLKERCFVDLSVARWPDCATAYPALAFQGGTNQAFWVALLDGLPQPRQEMRLVSFDDWWNGEAVFLGHDRVDDNGVGHGKSYSRHQLVEMMRDHDRAHNDTHWPVEFWNLKDRFMIAINDQGIEVPDDRLSPIPALFRHIGHELIRALEPGYRRDTIVNGDDQLIMIQMEMAYEGSAEYAQFEQDRAARLRDALDEPHGRRARRRARARARQSRC